MNPVQYNLRSTVAKQRIMPVAYSALLTDGAASDEERFMAAMRSRFGSETTIVPLGRARIGLYLLVKFATRHVKRKVLMSSMTIADVVNMVVFAGGQPVFFDSEPNSSACDLATLHALLDNDVACVLITHQHLVEPHLDDLVALCRDRGIPLYDDCAIAFGASYRGRPVGTLTDGSVFSFSSFKLLNFFWGGLLTTRDPLLSQFVAENVAPWPRLRRRDYLKPLKGCLKYDLASRPLLFARAVFPLFQRRTRREGAPRSLEHSRVESTGIDSSLKTKPSLVAFREWNRKLARVDIEIRHRRSIAEIYRTHLGPYMVTAARCEQVLHGSVFVNFPIVVPQGRADAVCKAMMLAGFDLGRNLYPNVHQQGEFASLPGRTRNVAELVRNTLYLPTHFGVDAEYASATAQSLLRLLEGQPDPR